MSLLLLFHGLRSSTLQIGSLPHAAVAGGVRLSPLEMTRRPMSVEVIPDPTDVDTFVELETVKDLHFADPFVGDGEGSMSIKNTSADMDVAVLGSFLRWRIDEEPAFLSVITKREKLTLPEGEHAAARTKCMGPGVIGALAETRTYPIRWTSEVQDPRPKQTNRTFNFGTPPFDDSGWLTANEVVTQATIQDQAWSGRPPAWPDPDARWIQPPLPEFTLDDSPSGVIWYDRRTFTAPEADDVLDVALYYGADDDVSGFFDGQLFVDSINSTTPLGGFHHLAKFKFQLTPGTDHTIAWVIRNRLHWTPGPFQPLINPTGIVWSLQHLVAGAPDGFIVHSDSDDRCLVPPVDEPPYITVGQVLQALIFEGVARGQLTWLTWDFDGFTDSLGNAWPHEPAISVRVGDSLLEVLHQLNHDGHIQWRMDAYRPMLHVYIPGTYGVDSGVAWSFTAVRADARLTELRHDEAKPPATHILVEYKDGMIEVEAPGFDPEEDERIEGFLPLDVDTVGEARTVGNAVVASSSQVVENVGVGVRPRAFPETPYRNTLLTPGHYVSVPNSDLSGNVLQRLSGVTADLDENNYRTLVPEVAELSKEQDELRDALLRRAAPGIGSIYPVTGRPVPPGPAAEQTDTPAISFSLGEESGTAVDTDVNVTLDMRTFTMSRFVGTGDPVTIGTSTASLYVDGLFIASVTIADGESTASTTLVTSPAPYPTPRIHPVLQPTVNKVTVVLDEATTTTARHTALLVCEEV